MIAFLDNFVSLGREFQIFGTKKLMDFLPKLVVLTFGFWYEIVSHIYMSKNNNKKGLLINSGKIHCPSAIGLLSASFWAKINQICNEPGNEYKNVLLTSVKHEKNQITATVCVHSNRDVEYVSQTMNRNEEKLKLISA